MDYTASLPNYILGISGFALFLAVLLLLLKYLILASELKKAYVILEITPSHNDDQTPLATEKFLTILHSLGKQQSWLAKLIGKKKMYSLEVVSTKEKGIRFLIRTNHDEAQIIKKHLLSFLPGAKIISVEDYFPDNVEGSYWRTVSLRLSRHFSLPLQEQKHLNQHDPISYITGQMTKLEDKELVVVQFVVTPALRTRIRNTGAIIKFLLNLLVFLLLTPLTLAGWIVFQDKKDPFPFWLFDNKKPEGKQPVAEKIDKELFEVSIRLYVSQQTKKKLNERIKGLITSFAGFQNVNQQSLRVKRPFPFVARIGIIKRFFHLQLKHRILAITENPLLSAGELAGLFHFPTSHGKTEDLKQGLSKQLPAPLSLKRASKLDIYIAQNTYGGSTTKIGLSKEERRRHMYILGATGTGKSTLLLSMITHDLQNGKGLCVIDPHGDLIENVLPSIPDDRINDVIYFNPDDIAYPIGLNLLELTPGLSEDDALREKEFITESILSLFHKLYTEKYSGPRMEYILRNAIYTAFTTENPTLFTIYKLLINTAYRKSVVSKLTDENLKDFWRYEFSKAGDYQKVTMISPITNKIGRFLFSPTAKRILEQEKSGINFDKIMDEGKILLCNLSKGKLGEDTSEVFGILIMTKIQLAALKRARSNFEDRKDFYLYVDEFQNFATPSFAQILSEARKYRLNAILAHQTTSQLEDKSLVNITLANTGTIICFRTANPEDEKLILPQFTPYIQQGEIANLPSFHFYMKINALNPEIPFSGETMLIDGGNDKRKVAEIIQSSREHYATPYQPKEEEAPAIIEKKITRKKKPAVESEPLNILP